MTKYRLTIEIDDLGIGDAQHVRDELGQELEDMRDRDDFAGCDVSWGDLEEIDEQDTLITVSNAEHATILAALRFYQEKGQGDPFNRSDEIHEIACGGERECISLDASAIDELCERINCS